MSDGKMSYFDDMADYFDHASYRNQIALANYVPGPINPPEYYYEPAILECGHSEEDCGVDCGYRASDEIPDDYDEQSRYAR